MNDPPLLLDALRAGAAILDANARLRIASGVRGALAADGGFVGRDERSDIYYAPFALWVLGALGVGVPDAVGLSAYLDGFGDGGALDHTHRTSLAQALVLSGRRDAALRVADRLAADAMVSPYGRFLTAMALLSVGRPLPPEGPMCDDSPAEHRGRRRGVSAATLTTPETAAGILLRVWRGQSAPEALVSALNDAVLESGGVRASRRATEPDLLSTATGLFALRQTQTWTGLAHPHAHVAFVSACWRDSGLFASAPSDPDDRGDVEYAFYALLALGTIV
jgi:hypothetical protein